MIQRPVPLFISSMLFALLYLLTACNTNTAEKKYPSSDSSVFYPVNDYFKTELKAACSAQFISYISPGTENKKDSSVIDTTTLIQLAKPFFEDDINDVKIKKNYRESIFHDQGTASNTFNYQSTDNTLRLQAVDILLDTVTNAVKRVFLTRSYTNGDSLIHEKMGWKTGESFFINRAVKLPGNKETMQQFSVQWKY